MTIFTMSLWIRNPKPCKCLSSFPLKKILCRSSVVVWLKFFHLISQSPRMFHLYLTFSWSFPAALSVLVFQVPMVMLSLPRIFDYAPVACLTPPSWCTAEGAVLVDPFATDLVWYGCLLSSRGKSLAKYNLTEPIPLQVEHVAVEFIVEPFRPSGSCLVLWRYPPSDAVLTPAISPKTERLVAGGSVFLPVQVQRTCSLPIKSAKQIPQWAGLGNYFTCPPLQFKMLFSIKGQVSRNNHPSDFYSYLCRFQRKRKRPF